MKATPLQIVKDKFQTRANLVDTIIPLLDGADDGTRARLMSASNRKLLRIHETALIVRDKFGGRKNLKDAILTARYPKGNPDDGFLKRLEEASLKRLLELHRQVGA